MDGVMLKVVKSGECSLQEIRTNKLLEWKELELKMQKIFSAA